MRGTKQLDSRQLSPTQSLSLDMDADPERGVQSPRDSRYGPTPKAAQMRTTSRDFARTTGDSPAWAGMQAYN
jgi:hypothetical protein